jgi:predicted metal-binding membrane protein
MMVAMMLPSAAPILLLFARVNRTQKVRNRPYVATGFFAAGYLTAWSGFSRSPPDCSGDWGNLICWAR